jgi:ABC-type nitrate/sulfonate/bicarbonate transport system substrate-binding protein
MPRRTRLNAKSHVRLIVVCTGVCLTIMTFALLSHTIPDTNISKAPLFLSMQLSGPYDASVAGELVAEKSGIFEHEGLHVDFKAGLADDDVIRSVAHARNIIGVVDAGRFLISRAQGESVVAIAASFLESTVVYYVLENSAIKTPYDFTGRRIGLRPDQDTAIIYEAMMAKLRLSRSSVKEKPIASGIWPLVRGEVDVLPGHIGAEGYLLKQDGINYRIISPVDYGVHVPGRVYIVSAGTILNESELLRRFVRGLIAGWVLTYENYVMSIPFIASFDPITLTPDLIRFKLDQQREFLRPLGTRFSEFDYEEWKSLQNILVQQRRIKNPVGLTSAVVNEFVRDAYRRSEKQ